MNGKVILITGASKGIGLSSAIELCNQGMKVVILSKSEKIFEAAKTIKSKELVCYPYKCDLSNMSQIKNSIIDIEKNIGPIWGLVNNAAALNFGSLLTTSEKDFDLLLSVNFKGLFFLSQIVAKEMIKRKDGRIINISSVASAIVRKNQIIYSSLKAALNHLTKIMAIELGSSGIRVNGIAPGITNTDMLKNIILNTNKQLNDFNKEIPIGAISEPDDIAKFISYLLSEAANGLNGQIISYDGGQSINYR